MSEYFEYIHTQIAVPLYTVLYSHPNLFCIFLVFFIIQFCYTFKAFERMFESFKRESLGLIMCVIGAAGDVSNCYDVRDFTESIGERKKILQKEIFFSSGVQVVVQNLNFR